MKKTIIFIIASITANLFFGSCEKMESSQDGNLVPLTVTEDPEIPSIKVNNTTLHAESFGNPNDPMVVVIHGGPGGDYRSILNSQEISNDGFYVVFYDQRGSGLSERHPKEIYSTQLMIDDLRSVINYYKKDNQKVFLLGHSWGAMLAAGYLDQYPNTIDGSIFIEPGGFTWNDTKKYLERSQPTDLFSENMNDFVYQDQFISGSDYNTLDYKFSLGAANESGNTTGMNEPTPFWRYGAHCHIGLMESVDDHPFNFTTHLSQYQPKVLFVYSELNKAYGRSHAELVSSPFTNLELVQIQGSGHDVIFSKWDTFYPVVLNYLNSLK